MKKKNILPIALTIVTIVLALIIYWFSFKKDRKIINQPQTPSPTASQIKIFQSKNLDFTLQIPKDFNTEEGLTFVEFKKGERTIGLGRVANASPSLDDYLSDFDQKNKTKEITEIKELEINGHPTKVRDKVRGLEKVRLYYIFTPDWVYVFSTKSEELYDDLDQIAKSFRYTP